MTWRFLRHNALILVLCLGCGRRTGPETGIVVGQVSLDGQPLSSVVVTFQPELGRPSTGETDESGKYTLRYSFSQSGALPGTHVVMITPQQPSDAAVSAREVKPPRSIPEKYNKKSELSAEVKPGQNTFNFELTSN